MNKRYKLLLKKLLLCSLLVGSALTLGSLQADGPINAENSAKKKLDFAIDHGELAEIKNILTEHPELINAATLGIHRETPLIRAVSQPNPKTQSEKDVFDYLLNFNNVDVNALDARGFSALDLALINFVDDEQSDISRHMCKELVKKGAKVHKNYEEKALEQIKEEVKLESESPAVQDAPDLAVITEQLEEQKAELAQLEQEKSTETQELAKTEEKLEEVKILPIEPIAPIKKKVATHKEKIAQKNDAIAVCKREIYLLEQAKIKAARRAAALQAADQPKKQQSVQDFYSVKKAPKRKSRIRGGRVVRRGTARKKSSKRAVSRKKSNKRGAKRKGSAKRKQARRQAHQEAE